MLQGWLRCLRNGAWWHECPKAKKPVIPEACRHSSVAMSQSLLLHHVWQELKQNSKVGVGMVFTTLKNTIVVRVYEVRVKVVWMSFFTKHVQLLVQ